MSKRQYILDEEYADFLQSWYQEKNSHPGGWVQARMLNVTGFMLVELVKAGKIDSNGYGFKPR